MLVSSGLGQVNPQQSVVAKLLKDEALNVGFANYSSYSLRDIRTGEVKGLSVELARYVANLFKVPINFYEVEWGGVPLALMSRRIDVFVTVIFTLPERQQVIDFSLPFAFFDYAIGVVRKGETRFKSWQELNDPKVKVAMALGEASHLWAKKNLPNATLLVFGDPTTPGLPLAFSAVAVGQADIALADKRSVIDVLRARPEMFEARWLDNPPATSPAALALPKGDRIWQLFLNGVISTLCAEGTIQKWAQEFDAVEVRCVSGA
jgi:polar amino acid transport system substrate-binding protein